MNRLQLFHLFDYTDVDRAFWSEHLEEWLPTRVFDAHYHFANEEAHRIEKDSEEIRKQYWVWEVNKMPDAETAERAIRVVFPGRKVTINAFAFPSLGWDIEDSSEYVRTECLNRGWHCSTIIRPTWVPEQVDALLAKPGVIGVKVFYAMLGYTPDTREGHIEANILDFLPPHQLEVLERRRAWVVLHVPKRERLGDPGNLRQIRQIRDRYPNVKLVIAHLGRSYTEYHARKGLLPLADDPGIYFDNSAVLNPQVHYLALKQIGPERIMYGTDSPVMYLRGRRRWRGRQYINHTSLPLRFNTNRESPEIEAKYTLYMYEALRAAKDACTRLGFGRSEVESLFHGTAERLVQDILERKQQLAGTGDDLRRSSREPQTAVPAT